jgi:glycosyltransferase involved in cell wall biosynthesis
MKLLHIGLCVSEIENGFQKAFKQVLGAENYFEVSTAHLNLNGNIIQLFNECKPDLVFMQIQAPNIVDNQIMDYMNESSFVINWTGDKREGIPQWMLDAAPFVSLTSFSNMEDVREMQKLGYKSEYLEIGFDETIYTNEGTNYPSEDILFMANNYGGGYFPMSEFRIQLANELKSKYQNKFGLYGSGWANGSGNVNHSQSVEAQYYRGCKIAINCSHFNVARYNSDRLLRILGSGTFCLSYKHPEMEQDYENYKHLVYYESIEDLKNKIDYYLENEEERKQIADNGRQLVLNRNTFKHQVENIIKLAQ